MKHAYKSMFCMYATLLLCIGVHYKSNAMNDENINNNVRLLHAAYYENYNLVKKLLTEELVDPNFKDNNCNTVLHYATAPNKSFHNSLQNPRYLNKEQNKIVALLIESGANPCLLNNKKETMDASKSGNVKNEINQFANSEGFVKSKY